MNRRAWHQRVSSEEAYRRASGRRAYNAVRTLRVELRRIKVARMLRQFPGIPLVDIADALGVHRSTVSRDRDALMAEVRRAEALRQASDA
jgi:DNA-binding MarR family transcriptional regulator